MRFEHARLFKVHGEVQCSLSAESWEQRIRLFFCDDRFENGHAERLDIGRVGEIWVGHDRGRVRVCQDHPVALFEQDAARLGARVIELTRLTNNDRA